MAQIGIVATVNGKPITNYDVEQRLLFLQYATNIAPKLTIQGGTTEVLRGIIARGLGLR